MTVFGRLVEDAWRSLAERYSHVELDECIVMPNHFHGIVTIGQPGAANSTGRAGKSLGSLVAVFKTTSTNQINRSRGTLAKAVWQRGFYDHVIRNEAALARIRRYIVENPAAWPADPENPALISQGDRSRR
jgi:putative transposase